MIPSLDIYDAEADRLKKQFARERLTRHLQGMAAKLTADERSDLADYQNTSNRRLAILFEKVFGRAPIKGEPLIPTFQLLGRFLATGKVPA